MVLVYFHVALLGQSNQGGCDMQKHEEIHANKKLVWNFHIN
jgi:hypothetical protein